ncbi:MAG: ABC transporter permease [Lachnospiraceae bacterium]|nr:ABC transporter permease [Lachnospiraceae bacterium]MBQ2099472.1 ABC transporter permease [Lachnospiraceae bacterium]MBQ3907014.1 ABC transporter permease [Lachnospiraceae bacterium]MCR4599588.1 ABC transporter permease [Acetatifactor sp.]
MKLGKKGGIALFSLLGVIAMAVIILHQNLGPAADPKEELLKKVLSCLIIAGACIGFACFYDRVTGLAGELIQSRHLIWKLAKNDFKKRYAGSYLGAIWAMVQPVVTVALYYIVFDKIMNGASRTEEAPFVLFLTAGLVPWFFFSEALNAGTNALREYDYLVKKVVFKISILPIIKIIAATFIHAFFICVLLIVAALYGNWPTIYLLQIFYYSACLFLLVLAICYTTCSVVVFFKDLSQIISILLQIGMWATPILWDINNLPEKWQKIIKLNPLTYIVSGYRDAVYNHRWFFQDFFSTVYFWMFTIVVFGIGTIIFKRLKVHFADVL